RHHCASRRARSGRGRAAGAGYNRRSHHTRRARAQVGAAGFGRRARQAQKNLEGAAAPCRQRPWLFGPVPARGAAGGPRRRFRFPRTREIVTETSLPKISVVVTCYNCRDYIADAIRSVARQTLRDFECVIVDDASTDDSAAVIDKALDE